MNTPNPSPPDWRGLCEELANYLQGRKDRECGWPGEDPEQDLIDRARAALAAEADGPAVPEGREPASVVGEPSDEELDVLADEWLDWNLEGHRAFARAALARYGHQPAPPAAGEVGELVAWLRERATWCAVDDPSHEKYDRAADLLERHPAPVPVAERLPELRGMFERILCVARSSGNRPVGNIELADRLIKAVVSWAALPLPQGEVE